jgi:hypothetical protein
MKLLALFDAEDEGSTILPNVDNIYKSTGCDISKHSHFEPDIDLCVQEIRRRQQLRFFFPPSVS